MSNLRLLYIAVFSLVMVVAFVQKTCNAQPEYTFCITRCSDQLISCWDSCPQDSNFVTCRDSCIVMYNQCTPTCSSRD